MPKSFENDFELLFDDFSCHFFELWVGLQFGCFFFEVLIQRCPELLYYSSEILYFGVSFFAIEDLFLDINHFSIHLA